MQKKMQKKFLVFEINACEWVALNCLYEEENTCQRFFENSQNLA